MSSGDIKIKRSLRCPALSRSRLNAVLKMHADFPISAEVMTRIDSTNDYLLRKAEQKEKRFIVCFAESQTRGRGRGDHRWWSPANGNLYLSVLTPYAPANAAWLSLMSAVMVARLLERLGVRRVGVKWPNDVLYDGRLKLAGLLIESRLRRYVLGLGFNVHLPRALPSTLPMLNCTALNEITPQRYDRNILAGRLAASLIHAFHQTDQSDVSKLMTAWQRYDLLKDRSLTMTAGDGRLCHGTVVGVDASARLLHQDRHGRRQALTSLNGCSIAGIKPLL